MELTINVVADVTDLSFLLVTILRCCLGHLELRWHLVISSVLINLDGTTLTSIVSA